MAVLSPPTPLSLVRNPRRRGPTLPPAGSIGALVNQRALTMGDRPAFTDVRDGRAVTWHDVAIAARKLRSRFGLRSSGVGAAGLRVGLAVTAPVGACVEYLAALAAGLPIAALDPASSDAELLWSTATLGLTHLIRDGGEVIELRPVRSGAEERHSQVVRGRAAHPSASALPDQSSASTAVAPTLVTATRGSTGAPKLVPLTEGQLLLAAANTVRHLRLCPNDIGYCPAPLHRIDTQVVGILAALLSGGSIVVGSFDRRSAWTDVDRCGATWLNLVPAMVSALTDVSAPGAAVKRRVRFVRVSGAELPIGTHSGFWQATGISLLESYSLAEAAGPVASNPVEIAGRRPGSVGLPVGVDVRIISGEGQFVPLGQTGRVQVRGATVVSHYLAYGFSGRDRAPLPAADPAGWLDTGDVGYRSIDGYLYLTGREAIASLGVTGAGVGAGLRAARRLRDEDGAAERSSQVACGTPASPLRAAAFRP
jgi:oxalate---CoA ligase